MKIDLKVADAELREIVKNLRETGFPEEIPISEVIEDYNENQKQILSSLKKLGEKEKGKDLKQCSPGDDHWVLREKIREKLQEAVKADLIHLGIIQRQAVVYGAIPDPEEKWKYYHLPDLNYACWKCGDEILSKTQRVSIHDGPFPLSGSGRVEQKTIPYCPSCNKEPSGTGIKNVDFAVT